MYVYTSLLHLVLESDKCSLYQKPRITPAMQSRSYNMPKTRNSLPTRHISSGAAPHHSFQPERVVLNPHESRSSPALFPYLLEQDHQYRPP